MRKYIIKTLLSLALVANISSCTNDQIDNDQITFHSVYDPVNYQELDTLMIGQLIQIVGDNFMSVSKISINNVDVPIGTNATVTKKSIYLNVPRIPKMEKNSIVLHSASENSIEKIIEVKFPPFRLSGMENEFTLPGDELVILGESLDLYLTAGKSKVLIGDKESEVVSVSEYEVKVRVPANVENNSVVKILNNELGEIVCPGRFRDTFFVIENLEDKSKTRYPAFVVPNTDFSTPLSPQPIEGNQYSRIVKSTSGLLNMVGNYNLTIPDDLLNEAEKYDLKFEMCTIEPLAFRFAVSLNQGTTNYMIGPSSATTNPEQQLSTSGKWKTFSIPLSYWKGKSGTKNLRVFVTLPSGVKYDLCLDNFRIQPK